MRFAWIPLLVCLASALAPSRLEASSTDKPSLVVVIVIDQLRGDYLDAFADRLAEAGFKRLSTHGAWFTKAYFTYGVTATGPGHASLLTGAVPADHGIVGNDWYDASAGGSRQYCCGDPRFNDLGYPEQHKSEGRSPHRLEVETLGSRIKRHTGGRGKVWSVALKDRAAILMGGKNADSAVWWDSQSGRFVSSTCYGPTLPDWATSFNSSGFADRFFHQTWDRLLPESAYSVHFFDSPEARAALSRFHSNEFPKVLGRGLEQPGPAYYAALYASPFGNELIFEAARRIVGTEQLGRDDAVDLLTLGLSSNDVVGHYFGPDSQEVMDCTLRTDRQLADFLDWLDRSVGLGRCIVALSSDHGVGPVTEYTKEIGLGGGRLDVSGLERFLEEQLRRRLPEPVSEGEEPNGDSRKLVRDVLMPWIFLDESAIRERGVEIDEVARIAAEVAVSFDGITQAFSAPDIHSVHFAGSDDLRKSVRNSYFPGRSGHVYLHWPRYWYRGKTPAGHGAAYDYDQHVPVMIMGGGVRPGRYQQRVSPTGMIVTLCRLLGVEAPAGATGELYAEALPKRAEASRRDAIPPSASSRH